MKTKRGNIDSIVAKILERKSKALPIAGALVQSQAKALCVVGQYPAGSGAVGGNLRNSIYLKVKDNIAMIGSNLVYAAIQEFGGPIVPVYARALTIPLIPQAIGKRARDFNNLWILHRKDGPPLLVRNTESGIEPVYVLLQRVFIPKQPYLRPALEMKRNDVIKILQAA